MSPDSGPRAAERVARTITVIAAAAATLLGAAAVGGMLQAEPYLAPAYTPLAVVIVFGGFAIVTVVTFLVRMPGIRAAHGAYAIAFVVVQVAWLPALQGREIPPELDPWVLEMTTVGTVPAAIAWRAAAAWAYLALNALIVGIVRVASTGGAEAVTALQYALLTFTLAGIFTALALVALRNAAAVDTATAELRAAAARSAAASARAHEQARLDALVHDEVMSTLFYASHHDGALDASVRAQAARALAQLEALRDGPPEPGALMRATEFVSGIRSVVLHGSHSFVFECHGTRTRAVPRVVAEAFAEATSEAVRNSILHAPDARHRTAAVLLSDERIEVIVRDDGRGFDMRDVPPHRLGISVSIRGRLAALDGGGASVASRTGRGTIVALTWREP